MSELKLYTILITLAPFAAREIAIGDVAEALAVDKLRSRSSVKFLSRRPNLEVSSQSDYYSQNPDTVILNIGVVTPAGLEESCLSMRTENESVKKLGNSIARMLKKITKAGATAVNPITGATAPSGTHRYSEGAVVLERAGVKILPVAGGNLYRLGQDA
jgi:hypothetical protein